MDITTITDLKELKAMAYDQMALAQQCESNLRAINGRIAELNRSKQDLPDKKSDEKLKKK